ncbi:MAG: cell division protein FtsZ, partial [Clostridia bacterium]|nr:cell division protein FtsZ [Clostridia bacterium]
LETSIRGAKGVLINIIGSPDLELDEVDEAASLVRENADPEATIIFGAAIDPELNDEMRITIIATGFEDDTPNMLDSAKKAPAQPAPRPTAPAQPARPAEKKETRDFNSDIDALINMFKGL